MKHLLCAVFLLLLSSMPVWAAATPSVHPVFNNDGAFAFCLADLPYEDGRTLTVALSPADEINIGLTIPKAGFKLGGQYDLTLKFDSDEARKMRGIAVQADALLLQFGNSPALTKDLKTSKNLVVTGGAKAMAFPIPKMALLYKELEKCIKENRGKVDSDVAKIEQEMPETLKALLIASGIKNITPLSMKDVPPADRPADFAWRTGNLLGGVREREMPKDKNFTELIGLHMQGLKNKCSGVFTAEVNKEEKAPGLTLRPAVVECKFKDESGKDSGGKDIVVAILFYLSASNHFTVFTHEAPIGNKAEALETRDAILKTVKGLATQVGGEKKKEK